MARFTAQSESVAALAVDTGFFWAHAAAGGGYKLRRVTLGVRAGVGAPTSQQCVVGINRVTTAGTTPTAVTASKLDPNSPAVTTTFASAFATAPTLTAQDAYRVAFNSQSGVDLPWELLEEFVVALGVTNGLGFINRDNALPASHQYVISAEVEE